MGTDAEGEWLSLGVKRGSGRRGVDFYEVGMRNGLDLCGGLLKQSQAIQQFGVTEYQSASAEWQISCSLTLTPDDDGS